MAAVEAQHEVQQRLILNVVVRESAAVLELFASEDEALLVGRGAQDVLDILLRVVDGVRGHDGEREGFARERLEEELKGHVWALLRGVFAARAVVVRHGERRLVSGVLSACGRAPQQEGHAEAVAARATAARVLLKKRIKPHHPPSLLSSRLGPFGALEPTSASLVSRKSSTLNGVASSRSGASASTHDARSSLRSSAVAYRKPGAARRSLRERVDEQRAAAAVALESSLRQRVPCRRQARQLGPGGGVGGLTSYGSLLTRLFCTALL